jgi:hypothetical protein
MDRIYSEAEVTIIAVAGADPTYGLPGVSTRFRKPQRSTKLPGIALVQMFYHTPHELTQSTWNSRAWTYQEGILAKRKLVFTDRQISFLCETTFYAESICTRPQPGKQPGLWRDHFRQVWNTKTPKQIVEQYSKRMLSYDSDALNACLGVLNSLDTWNHIWGVAFKINHSTSEIRHLAWCCKKPTRQREDFPSWSWVSRAGEIEYPYSSQVNSRCEYKIHGTDYRDITMYNGVRTGLPAPHVDIEASKVLEVTSYVFPVQLSYQTSLSRKRLYVGRAAISKDVFQEYGCNMDGDGEFSDVYAVTLNWSEEPEWVVDNCLIVMKLDDGFFARIGIVLRAMAQALFSDANEIPVNGNDLASRWPIHAEWRTISIK